MQKFPIYRVVSNSHSNRKQGPKMEIAVLTVRSVGSQAVMRSVNRHVEMVGGQWVGRHPDFYDGVDLKNADAEQMFAGLEAELAGLKNKLAELDEEIGQWTDLKMLNEFATEIANRFKLDRGAVLNLFLLVRAETVERLKARRVELMGEAVNVGVKKEHAQCYLADVQRDFPRLVVYVDGK